jgi:type I restriction enzyme S subunit
MSIETIRLGNECDFISGNAWKSSGFSGTPPGHPVVRIQNVCDNPEDFVYWPGEYNPRYLVNNGDFLLSLSGNVKLVEWKSGTALLNQRVVKLLPSSNFDRRWFYWIINRAIGEIERMAKHAVIANVSLTDLKDLKIPRIKDKKEQKRIAAILDKTDAIRRKRQQAIQLSDEFLRSVFLDMFGDPIVNTKKWPIEPLESFCSDVVDCPHSTPKYSNGKTTFPCLRSSDLQDGHLVFETTKYVDENVYRDRIARITPMQGDIIYCREGARLGNLAIVPEGLTPCLGQRTMLFRVDQNEATPNFLLTLLNNNGIKNEVSKKIIGAAAPRVNVKDLKEFQIIKPPLALQQRYEKIVLKYRSNRQRYIAHQQLSIHAFNALTQSAFRGEL